MHVTINSCLAFQEGVAVEIAEAVVGALRGELSATAVNAPMVPPEVRVEKTPFRTFACLGGLPLAYFH